MQALRQFRPTKYDHSPVSFGPLQDKGDWLVVPASRTRDSDALERSNFDYAVNILGGESDDVEIHRFGHWGPGWYEIVVVNPERSDLVAMIEMIESRLEVYPVLDEERMSEYESDEAYEYWSTCGMSERIRLCVENGYSMFSARHDTIPDRVYEKICR